MNAQTFEVLSALIGSIARLGSAVEAIRQQMPPGPQQDEATKFLHEALQSTKEAADTLTAIAADNRITPAD
jgi:hypothetical protein